MSKKRQKYRKQRATLSGYGIRSLLEYQYDASTEMYRYWFYIPKEDEGAASRLKDTLEECLSLEAKWSRPPYSQYHKYAVTSTDTKFMKDVGYAMRCIRTWLD